MKAANRVATDPGVPNVDSPRVAARRYVAAGDLDAVRLGRRTIRIKIESIDHLIEAHPANASRRRSA